MKNKKHILFYVTTLIIIKSFIISCKKEKGQAPDLGYNYYPTTIGWFIEYEIDSIVYNDFTNSIDTTHYYLKEVIESEIESDIEIPSFRIERYKRKNINENWLISDVWFGIKSNNNFIKVEENIKYVKLIFPVKNGARWNGNNYNTQGEQIYEYENKDEAFILENSKFDSTVIVKQFENINLIEKQEYKEVYARNIGLIYKEMIDLKTEVNGSIKSGYRYYQKIKSYGKN
ncbi:MAG: hypothetical protein ACK4IK_10030 [Bacteroidia bacterium]